MWTKLANVGLASALVTWMKEFLIGANLERLTLIGRMLSSLLSITFARVKAFHLLGLKHFKNDEQ